MAKYQLHSSFDRWGEPSFPELVMIELESGKKFSALGEVQDLTPDEHRIVSKHFTLVPVRE